MQGETAAVFFTPTRHLDVRTYLEEERNFGKMHIEKAHTTAAHRIGVDPIFPASAGRKVGTVEYDAIL